MGFSWNQGKGSRTVLRSNSYDARASSQENPMHTKKRNISSTLQLVTIIVATCFQGACSTHSGDTASTAPNAPKTTGAAQTDNATANPAAGAQTKTTAVQNNAAAPKSSAELGN